MVEIREIGTAELDGWIEIVAAVRTDRAFAAADYVDWRRQADDMAWFIATRDGDDAGAAFAYVGWHSAPGTGNAEAFVLPLHRGDGVGQALYERLASWLIERGCVTLETTVGEEDAESLAWVDRRGFREVGRDSLLALDLTAVELPALSAPEGIEIVAWVDRPDLWPGVYEVAREAYVDIPGQAEQPAPPYDVWLANDMQGGTDPPEAIFVAVADGVVAGYAKLSISSAPGTTTAHHDITGVRRDFRRRGIAGALKRSEIAWAKERGYERLETSNEVRNEPIRRLNARHGYVVTPGVVVLRGSLAGIE